MHLVKTVPTTSEETTPEISITEEPQSTIEEPRPPTTEELPTEAPRDEHRRRVHIQQQIHEIRQLLLEAADRLIDAAPRDGQPPSEGAPGVPSLGLAGALTAAAQYRIHQVAEQMGEPLVEHPSVWAKGQKGRT